MKNNVRVGRGFRSVGEPSSKYAYNPEQFEKDIKKAETEGQQLYEDFIEFMKSHSVDPEQFRDLFRRYYEEFIAERG